MNFSKLLSNANIMHTKHALVVGGTGMLKGVSLDLANQGYTVTVIARNYASFDELITYADKVSSKVVQLGLDYGDSSLLTGGIQETIRYNGPISLAVAWVHDNAPDALSITANLVGTPELKCEFFHVQESVDLSELARSKQKNIEKFKEFPNINYHQVILGHVKGLHGFRWLTNDEISQGVLEAIRSGEDLHIVGQLE